MLILNFYDFSFQGILDKDHEISSLLSYICLWLENITAQHCQIAQILQFCEQLDLFMFEDVPQFGNPSLIQHLFLSQVQDILFISSLHFIFCVLSSHSWVMIFTFRLYADVTVVVSLVGGVL